MQTNSDFKTGFKIRLYNWTLKLIGVIDALDKGMVSNVMGKQLIRSGTSILANFIEAQSAISNKDFVNFLTYSLKSANESKVWLTLLRDTKKGDRNRLEYLLGELTEITKILASIIIKLKKK